MRFIIGFLIAIGILVLILILIFSGGSKPTPQQLFLPNYTYGDSFAEMTESGPITAPQNHYELSVTVSSTNSTLNVYNGYEGVVANTYNFAMDPIAYADFLYALQREGFTDGNNAANLKEDRGYCPAGRLYTFSFNNGNSEVEHYWANSCGNGNFEGNSLGIRSLFEVQIPGYDNLINGAVDLL
jgi:hypothetical protein